MSKSTCVVLVFGVCLVLTLGISIFLIPLAKDVLILEANKSLMASGKLLQQMDLGDQERLFGKMVELSNQESFQAIFEESPSGDQQGQDDWLKRLRESINVLAVDVEKDWPLNDFFLLDRTGLGIARRTDPTWFGDPPDKHPEILKAIKRAADGSGSFVVVRKDSNLLRAVAVPVISKGNVNAILFATFPVDNAFVKKWNRELSTQVSTDTSGKEDDSKMQLGYLTPEGIAGHSFDQQVLKAMEEYFSGHRQVVSTLLSGAVLKAGVAKQTSALVMVAGFPLLSQGGSGSAGIILARNVKSIYSPINSLTLFVIISGFILFVAAAYVMLFLGPRLDGLLSRYDVFLNRFQSSKGKVVEKPTQEAKPEQPRKDSQVPERPQTSEQPAIHFADAMGLDNEGELPEQNLKDEDEELNLKNKEEVLPEQNLQDEYEELGSNIKEDLTPEQNPQDEYEELENSWLSSRTQEQLVQDEKIPTQDEKIPTKDEKITTKDKKTPTKDEKIPTKDKKIPTKDKKIPTKDEIIPAENTTTQSDGANLEPLMDVIADTKQETSLPNPDVVSRRSQQHYREVYREFLRAKERLGETIDRINFERFVSKLKKQEVIIKERHACRRVDFEVVIKDKKISLHPRIIR